MTDNPTVLKSEEDYKGNFYPDLIEQYKIVRSAIVDLINDRNTNYKFIFTILTAFFAISGYGWKQVLDPNLEESKVYILITLTLIHVLGVYLSNLWKKLNKTFFRRIEIRYELLRNMEIELPAAPFTRELEIRMKDDQKTSLARLNNYIAFAFGIINAILAIVPIIYYRQITDITIWKSFVIGAAIWAIFIYHFLFSQKD